MLKKLIVKHCAPTLAGIKTGNLFNCAYTSKNQLIQEIVEINKCCADCDICTTVLAYLNERALIYLYRPSRLKDDFCKKGICEILEERGYPICDICKCLDTLSSRVCSQQDFPHEIGCFLGYPACDVRGFIDGTKPCKLVGTWKVYEDEEIAKHLFKTYAKCTNEYMEHFEKGMSLEQLIKFAQNLRRYDYE